jgi:hypothetical protein
MTLFPSARSLIGWSAAHRVPMAGLLALTLWLAIWWAVVLP